MKLQVINSYQGKPEYVLLPISVYASLRSEIEKSMQEAEYVDFDATDYVENPITLARIKAHITQQELAELMGVTQAYISKIENQDEVAPKTIEKVSSALIKLRNK